MTPLDDRGVPTDEHGVPTGPENTAYVRAVHDRGLSFDLRTMSRRSMLGLAGGLGAFSLVGCETSGSTATSTSAGDAVATGSSSADSTAADCATPINSETNGPYPADGSNGVEIRTADGAVRTDIRSSFGSSTGTAQGVPMMMSLTLQHLSCAPLAGAAVYVWHCDRDGNYSLYSQGITDQNYLRGIGETDATGMVTFTSIFPACYSGRWPHVHFEIYPSVADATSGSGTILKASQLAFPEDVCGSVYASDGYSRSAINLGQVSLSTDNVFSDDDAAHQLGTVTGSVADGYAVALTVTVDPSATEAAGSGSGGAPGVGAPGGTPPNGMGGRGGTPPTGGPGGAPTS